MNKQSYGLAAQGGALPVSRYKTKLNLNERVAVSACWQVERRQTKHYFARMCDSLQQQRSLQGKSTQYYHYSNESRMLNKLLLGVDSKSWLASRGLCGQVRDHLTEMQLSYLAYLERCNADLIDAGLVFSERKRKLAIMLSYHTASAAMGDK
ncbi:MAG: hypothetical protein WBH20_08485 [Oceanisphaera sp.]|uniref:hypothetical protein n=1 Tax=Oceanisphaera sp. TaxID=1929979 RepID=UPI003C7158A8